MAVAKPAELRSHRDGYIHREVLDDHVSYNPIKNVLEYFGEHAEVFYRVARRKFDADEMDGNLLRITNGDFEIGELPVCGAIGARRSSSLGLDSHRTSARPYLGCRLR